MYNHYAHNTSSIPINFIASENARYRRNSHVGLGVDSDNSFYNNQKNIIKVAPAPPNFNDFNKVKQFAEDAESNSTGLIYDLLRPVIMLQRAVGIYPVSNDGPGSFKVTTQLLIYSASLICIVLAYIGYIQWQKIEMMNEKNESKFEEAVIDYLFTVYLIPIVINPIVLYEARHHAKIMNEFYNFEKYYERIVKRKMEIVLGNKPLMITIALPVIACATMVVNHITMVHFRAIQVIPYCYINAVTYLIGGLWFVYCDVIGQLALLISQDFQYALKNFNTSSRIAEFRSLWMLLAKITRECGVSSGYTLIFLCLYLFFIITLTVYGLLSQIQNGFGMKDIGLTITAVFAIVLLYFICDEAHYASNCVKVNFQKKLLLVELTWMNEESQEEINMFLRATEMNPTNISLVGFFDVNRNLFKSLLATMVTYLVVLLQFQISIPEDRAITSNSTKT